MASASVVGSFNGFVQSVASDWATARAAETGTARSNTVLQTDSGSIPAYPVADITRGFLVFDTSELGAGATVTEAILSVYIQSADEDKTVHLVASTQAADDSLSTDDFDAVGSTSFGSIASGTSALTQKTFTLNASGLAAIVVDGNTKFAFRQAADLANEEPASPYNYETNYCEINDEVAARRPTLSITYTPAALAAGTHQDTDLEDYFQGDWTTTGDYHEPDDEEAYIEFDFTGTGFDIYGPTGTGFTNDGSYTANFLHGSGTPYGTSGGVGKIEVDETTVGYSSAYSAGSNETQLLFSVTDLTSGTYTITITNLPIDYIIIYNYDGTVGGGGGTDCLAYGTKTTAAEIDAQVRIRLGIALTASVVDDSVTTVTSLLYDIINFNVERIAGEYPDWKYACLYNAGVPSTSVDLSGKSLSKILKIRDSINGLVKVVGAEEFEHIQTLSTNYAGSVVACHQGETLNIFQGSGVSELGYWYIYYRRIPIYVDAPTDYPDVPDSDTALLIDMVTEDMRRWLPRI